jgi:hypothetical protein
MKNFRFTTTFISLVTSIVSLAQVGIGTLTPDASSSLDVSSTSQGFLMPRLSSSQRDAILLPAKGLMIYNLTLDNGETNTGTPINPKWVGTNTQETPTINSITEGGIVSTESTSNVLVPEMTISPDSGTYLVLFNAQHTSISGGLTFSSSQGVIDASDLYNQLMAYPDGETHNPTFGSGETLSPGVYDVSGAASIAGTLTLDGGTATENPIFIIRGSAAFTTTADTNVVLTGNAKPENIFWVSGAAMSTAANTVMKGTMLGGGVGAGAVSLGADSNLEGRLFTKLGGVTLGENVVITSPIVASPDDLGVLSTFTMWSSDGAVSDVATATTTGDVGTAAGTLTMTGTHTGEEYPSGTVSSSPKIATSTYSIYKNEVEISNSSRIITSQSAVVSLQGMVIVEEEDTVEIRWKVETGEVRLDNRTMSLIRSQ